MDDKEKLALVYRLMSGYTIINIGKTKYVVDTPDTLLFNESLQVYEDSLKSNRYDEFIRNKDTEDILWIHKQWSKISSAKELKELESSIETAKLNLFNVFGMPQTQVKKVRLHLQTLKQKRNSMLAIKHSLDDFTLEGYAEWEAEQFLFERLIRDTEYKPITVDAITLNKIIREYKRLLPSVSEFRLLARTDPWRSVWNVDKNCLRVKGDEQKMLLIFTNMYDSVYENSERPPEEVINDDDMLDGWFLHMKKQMEEDKRERAKNSLTERFAKAGEIFAFTQEQEEAKEIVEMNDIRGKIIQNKIHNAVAQQGYVRDMDIQELRIEHMGNQGK